MKNIKLGLCFLDENDEIIVRRTVKANWTIDAEQDLKMFHNIHIRDEIAAIFTEHLKLELDSNDIVKEMLDELYDLNNPEQKKGDGTS